MEGVILEQSFTTLAGPIGGLILLGLVVAAIFLGSMAEKEKRGEHLYWAAEPIPGTEEAVAGEEEGIPKAA